MRLNLPTRATVDIQLVEVGSHTPALATSNVRQEQLGDNVDHTSRVRAERCSEVFGVELATFAAIATFGACRCTCYQQVVKTALLADPEWQGECLIFARIVIEEVQ